MPLSDGIRDLLDALLARREYDRAGALTLCRCARNRAAEWPLRAAAALMLEHTLLRIPPGDEQEHRFWFRELGIEGLDVSTFRSRLARLDRVHAPLREPRPSSRAIGDFLHLARRDCRITVARWLWTADEIFQRIEAGVKRSEGIRSRPDFGHTVANEEARAALDSVPPLERDLLLRLGHQATVRWVARSTSSEINSLLEYPLGTVVMVVKPPGSDHEIEIKRTGLRGPFPLDALYERGDWILPSSHFLQGGSMESHLGLEMSQSSVMSRLYRTVHGTIAPMCRTVYLATVFTIPSPAGEVDLFDYFTDPRVFGERYPAMRRHMGWATSAMARASNQARAQQHNNLSLTVEFLGLTKPSQAVQIGTTSFRLDRLAMYLAPDGAASYFKELGVPITNDDARRFAGELLDEVLCNFDPPKVPFRSYRTYLDAAFRVPANRKRANHNYLSALEQIGRFWGTLLAARGHSYGESFVGRNCGLRSVFEDGQWRIRVIFMDHDSIAFAARYEDHYHPRPSVRGAAIDAKFILGRHIGDYEVKGEIEFLRDIYRVTSALERRGIASLKREMKAAYDKAQHAVRTVPELDRCFRPVFIKGLGDWDEAVRYWLASTDEGWQEQVRAMLFSRGYDTPYAENYIGAIDKYSQYLEWISFLFQMP